MIQSCASKQDCQIIPGKKFSGTGLIVLQRGQGQDGWFYMQFHPKCEVDTADLLASLRNSEAGLAFATTEWHRLIGPTTYGKIKSPFREKTQTLTAPGVIHKNVHCWDCGLNDIFLIPVRITFTDTLASSAATAQASDYSLKTTRGIIPLRLRGTGAIQIQELSPL
jgi:hypothetical protein